MSIHKNGQTDTMTFGFDGQTNRQTKLWPYSTSTITRGDESVGKKVLLSSLFLLLSTTLEMMMSPERGERRQKTTKKKKRKRLPLRTVRTVSWIKSVSTSCREKPKKR